MSQIKTATLTKAQMEIWTSEKMHPNTRMWNNAASVYLRCAVNETTLMQAVRIAKEQEVSLGIRFFSDASGPYQSVCEATDIDVEPLHFKTRRQCDTYAQERLNAFTLQENAAPYEIWPFVTADGFGGIFIMIHHILSDAFSLVHFADSFISIYEELALRQAHTFAAKPSFLVQAKKEEEYLKSSRFLADKDYWGNEFSHLPEKPLYPIEAQHGTNAKRQTFALPQNLQTALQNAPTELNSSVFALFLTALSYCLASIHGVDELIIGAPVYNRPSRTGGIGMYVNTIPIRITIRPEMRFVDLHEQVMEQWLAALKHRNYPHDMLVRQLRQKGELAPLYSVVLSYQNASIAANHTVEYDTQWFFPNEQLAPLNIHISNFSAESAPQLHFDYLTEVLTDGDINQLYACLCAFLYAGIVNPQELLCALPMMDEETYAKVLSFGMGKKIPLAPGKTALTHFVEHAQKHPEKPAVRGENATLTYGELLHRARCVAGALLHRNVSANSTVMIFMDRSPDYIAALLGVCLAGAAYCPVDTHLPAERVAYMAQDAQVALAIVDGDLPFAPDVPTVTISALLQGDAPEVLPSIAQSSAAYIIYTSGSTGMPKGVCISHGALLNFTENLSRIWDFSPQNACMLAAASISFDLGVMEVWGALANSATVAICSQDTALDPKQFGSFIVAQQVDRMLLTPARMELLFLGNAQGCLAQLRKLALGGERLDVDLLQKVRASTQANLYNMYGPTENAIVTTYKKLTAPDNTAIGKPLDNVDVYVLNTGKTLVPLGIPGELYIGGKSLAMGYIGAGALQMEQFVPHPFAPDEVLYRTGDAVFWDEFGDLHYVTRLDGQVKIRGYRIELGEIEAQLKTVPGVRACVVVDVQFGGTRQLAAYFMGDADVEQIRLILGQKLPNYMVPGSITQIDEIPLTHAGKVDKGKLPAPLYVHQHTFAPPQGAAEETVAAVWKSILHVDSISRNDMFFALGGDSLSLIAAVELLQKEMGYTLPVAKAYTLNTLMEWAAELGAMQQTQNTFVLQPAPILPYYPATPAQQRMYVLEHEAKLAYHVPMAFRLPKGTDVMRLKRAFFALHARHEPLRTAFRMVEGELCQFVLDAFPVQWQEVDCPRNLVLQTLQKHILPMDMDTPVLSRGVVAHTPTYDVFMWDLHHIIGDGITIQLFLNELQALYNNQPLAEIAFTYPDYAVWYQQSLQNGTFSFQRKYWQNTLQGELPTLGLHTDFPRKPTRAFLGKQIAFTLADDISTQVHEFAKRHNITPQMVLLSAYFVFLFKQTGQQEAVVGVPSSGRTIMQTQQMAGLFVTTLPIFAKQSFEDSFADACQNVSRLLIEALSYSDYPLDGILADLAGVRNADRNPLFDTMFVYRSEPVTPPKFSGAAATPVQLPNKTSKMDITLEIEQTQNGFSALMEYDTQLFTHRTVLRFIRRYCTVLSWLLGNATTPLKQCNALDAQETNEVLMQFQQTQLQLPQKITLEHLFERFATETPDKTALWFHEATVSYAQLNAMANAVATHLLAAGLQPGGIVAICSTRNIGLIAGILGIWKAGGGYLPIDPDYPKERIDFIFEDSAADFILTDTALQPVHGTVLYLPRILEHPHAQDPCVATTPQNIGYVIYTSGSTGRPKGVALTRHGVLNLHAASTQWADYKPQDVCVSITTVAFDIFFIDTLLPLLYGATVALCDEDEMRRPDLLAQVMRKTQATFLQATPSRMRMLLESTQFKKAAAQLTRVACAGEHFPYTLLTQLRRVTRARILNGYGPSETTVYSTVKDLTHAKKITIGKPIANTQIYLLDAFMQPVPVGVVGELYIAGDGVGIGYIARLQLTQECFLPDICNPAKTMYKTGDLGVFCENGEIELLGRVDHQIKLHGLRIELGEIEAKLRSHPLVQNAVVHMFTADGEQYLCAYLACAQAVDPAQIRLYLTQSLPAYMVPAAFVQMEALPMTPNGKVDKNALPPPQFAAVQTIRTPPQTAVQKKVALAWTKVLNLQDVCLEDDFFALGGDSLDVIRVQALLSKSNIELPTQVFFDCRTLLAVCTSIEGGTGITKRRVARGVKQLPQLITPLPGALNATVLLTGATGYLGVHILYGLYKRKCKVVCLVRAGSAAQAKAKIAQSVQYFYPAEATQILQQVEVALGDLSDAHPFVNVPGNVKTCIHCAAVTDHYGFAAHFKEINVRGTQKVVQWCLQYGVQLLHISTMSVLGQQLHKKSSIAKTYTESDFEIGQVIEDNEYVKSKYLAERAVYLGMQKGLHARIFRVGNLTARFCDGVFQQNPYRNAFFNAISMLHTLRAVPQGIAEALFDITPVDLCAEAILALSAQADTQYVYHVYNPGKHTLRHILQAATNTAMEPVQVLADAQVEALIAQLENSTEFLVPKGMLSKNEVVFDCGQTIEKLAKAGFIWPNLRNLYFFEYICQKDV